MPDFIIKVCGLTNYDDARLALDSGVNALGFNFYPKSPRFISTDKASEIIARLNGGFLRVGIFVHPGDGEIAAAAPVLDVAQIYGPGFSTLPMWRAVTAGTVPPPDASVEAWLLDSVTPEFGGSGQTFDWSLAASFPYRAIVAGGLDSINVGDAIRTAKPWGVDACSRLESAPGRKDHARVAAFARNALAAFHAAQVVSI